jgi:RNA polymerase sigma factor (sigma-70 family)
LDSLIHRAGRLGSRDPESAAQEALKRSLLDPRSQAAIEYYFAEEVLETAGPPEWLLDQLFAWLHAVLHYVVREEQARAGFRREVPMAIDIWGQRDPAPGPLEELIRSERQSMIAHCIPRLDRDYRNVIELRMEGLAYAEIASRLRVNPNTVATWLSRGIRALAQCIRRRAGKIGGSNA